jgi:quinohemoprotein ethanol dehydrogenase
MRNATSGQGWLAWRYLGLADPSIVAAIGLGLVLSACERSTEAASSGVDGPDASAAELHDEAPGNDWPAVGRTYGEQHFSPLEQINTNNVRRLGLAWFTDLEPGNAATNPIEINGVLFVSYAYSRVLAVDVRTGRTLWTFDPHAAEAAGPRLRQGWGSRGLAWWGGKVIVGTQDGRLLALNGQTGRQVWSVQTLQPGDFRFISGAPRVFAGKVIIGHGGADSGNTRGYVTAYDAGTGKQLWRFFTVPGNPARTPEQPAMSMAAKTWAGEWWKYGGGGTVWNAMTYDEKYDTVLIGTGNGAPSNHRIRSQGKGDNLFLSSIVALDAKTGAYRWHYQVNPGEAWDYNAAMDIQLATLPINGKVRDVAMTAPKAGFFYVLDRQTGKLLSAKPYVKVSWASGIDLRTGRPIEAPGIRYPNGSSFVMWPGPGGGHSWQPMAYNPGTRLVYIPTMQLPGGFTDKGVELKDWKRRPGASGDGGFKFVFEKAGPPAGTSALVAWNPVTQSAAWSVPLPGLWNGGVLTTAGNLVFQGRASGDLVAYDARNGAKLWSFAAQVPVIGPPISYSVDGRQYVTVVAGMGASGGVYGPLLGVQVGYREQQRRILTFALAGKASLPPRAPYVFKPAADPNYRADAAAELRGGETYRVRCSVCHGGGVIGGGGAPDLRGSSVPLDPDTFSAIVKDGALVEGGMPQFGELPAREIADVRQYVRAQAAKARKGMTGTSRQR